MPEYRTCKKCARCKNTLPRKMFAKDKRWGDGTSSYCQPCSRTKARASYRRNKAGYVQRAIEWAKKNPEKHAEHRKRMNIRRRETGQRAEASAKYRASKRNATVSWADKDAVDFVYFASKLLNTTCADKWEVDHIVPLQAEKACGLHNEFNLQLLEKTKNRAKRNQFEVI